MIKINLDDSNLSPEDSKRFTELCNKTVTLTVPVGTAMVVETVLKEVCDKLAHDSLNAIINGDDKKTMVMATMGMEIVTMGKAMNEAVAALDFFPELKDIALRSAPDKPDEDDDTDALDKINGPLGEFLAKRKETLQ
jgi:hypothetical protein